MILISGTNLTVEELPNNEVIPYKIENKKTKMGIALRTSAPKEDCLKIFISDALRTEYTITDEISSKLEYFNDDDELIRLLGGKTDEESQSVDSEAKNSFEEKYGETVDVDPFEDEETNKSSAEDKKSDTLINSSFTLTKTEEVEPEEEIEEIKADSEPNSIEFTKIEEETEENVEENNVDVSTLDMTKEEGNTKESSESFIPQIDLEMADTELPEEMQIPGLNDDTDALKMQLKAKDNIILQKDSMIEELQTRINESYELQEIQLAEVKKLYQIKMAEFQATINELQEKGQGVSLDDETMNFLKFINYANAPKAIAKEGFSEAEIQEMGKLNSKYYIFASGADDSQVQMYKQISNYIRSGKEAIIVDFSNDIFLSAVFKINSRNKNSLALFKDEISPATLLCGVENSKYIPSTEYNDIALLNVNWARVLRKIDDIAMGRNVILIFDSINSFNIRYTVSKLAVIGELYVFVKSSPNAIRCLYSELSFIPSKRVRIIALDYIDLIEAMLKKMSQKYAVTAVKKAVEWNKIGL